MKNFEDKSKEELIEILQEVTIVLQALEFTSRLVYTQIESPTGVTGLTKKVLKYVLDIVRNNIFPLVL